MIWIPNSNHSDGMCSVDSDWFDPTILEAITKKFPQPPGDTVRVPETFTIRFPESSVNYGFKEGCIPYVGCISTAHPNFRTLIFHRREPAITPSSSDKDTHAAAPELPPGKSQPAI